MAETITIPASVDLHVHLREPSTNQAETIYGGTRAALLGGFALVADMPNNPGMPTHTLERLDEKIKIAKRDAWIPTAFHAGSQPESDNIGELEAMAEKAIGLKLYGDPTTSNSNTYEAREFKEIVKEWHRVAPEKPILFHAGTDNLGDMIRLVAVDNQHPFHVCHVNNSEQINSVLYAKSRDLPVTCGVCPHHLMMTSHHVHSHGAFAEMKPPLAHQDEAEKLMGLLEAGHIDVIESDFAPHTMEAKYEAEEDEGVHCYGVPGIEHIMPVLFYQVKRGRLSERRLIEATSARPADILGVSLRSNTTAKWDLDEGPYRITESDIIATCGWSPYEGMLALGRLVEVKIGGQTEFTGGTEIDPNRTVVTQRGTRV